MKRGDIVVVATGTGYGSKPRPAIVVQSDIFDATFSITVCLATSNPLEAAAMRLKVEASPTNGLLTSSWLMVDKLITVPRNKIGKRVGTLAAEDITRLNSALVIFLGLDR